VLKKRSAVSSSEGDSLPGGDWGGGGVREGKGLKPTVTSIQAGRKKPEGEDYGRMKGEERKKKNKA